MINYATHEFLKERSLQKVLGEHGSNGDRIISVIERSNSWLIVYEIKPAERITIAGVVYPGIDQ